MRHALAAGLTLQYTEQVSLDEAEYDTGCKSEPDDSDWAQASSQQHKPLLSNHIGIAEETKLESL